MMKTKPFQTEQIADPKWCNQSIAHGPEIAMTILLWFQLSMGSTDGSSHPKSIFSEQLGPRKGMPYGLSMPHVPGHGFLMVKC